MSDVVSHDKTEPKFNSDTTARSGNSPDATVDLARFGFAERRLKAKRNKPGDVKFDELGNARYQWKDERMLEDGSDGDTRRLRALSAANLALVDNEPPPDLKTIATNQRGLRVGYNPYESGKLEKKQWKKTRDLRALSQWIATQRKLGNTDSE